MSSWFVILMISYESPSDTFLSEHSFMVKSYGVVGGLVAPRIIMSSPGGPCHEILVWPDIFNLTLPHVKIEMRIYCHLLGLGYHSISHFPFPSPGPVPVAWQFWCHFGFDIDRVWTLDSGLWLDKLTILRHKIDLDPSLTIIKYDANS